MKTARFGLVTIALGVLALCLPARANATTFTLDCLFSGGTNNVQFNGTCPAVASQGTITYDPTTGDGTITLTSNATGAKVFDLYVNLDSSMTFTASSFTFTGAQTNGFDCGAGKGTTCVDDSQKADGNSTGLFDLDLSFLANTNSPYTFNLKYDSTPLDLNFTNSDGSLLAAAHLGGFSGSDCSEWLGDSATNGVGTSTTGLCGNGTGNINGLSVPEPASMLLFGLGSIGVATRMRRRFGL